MKKLIISLFCLAACFNYAAVMAAPQFISPDKKIVAVGELVEEGSGSKIYIAKFKILKVLEGKIESDVISVGYYFYTQKNPLPRKALLTLYKYEAPTDIKNYYIAVDYNAEIGIQDYSKAEISK